MMENIRENMPSAAQDAVRRDCPEQVYFTKEGAGQARLATGCTTLRLDPRIIAAAAREVRSTANIGRDLTRLIADLDVKLGLINSTIGHRATLRDLLATADKAS